MAKGAEVNTKIVNSDVHDGQTPLHDAAWQGYIEIAESLIAKKRRCEWQDCRGMTPLDMAAKQYAPGPCRHIPQARRKERQGTAGTTAVAGA